MNDPMEMFEDEMVFPASFLSRLQPAGAFLQQHQLHGTNTNNTNSASSLQSQTALAQRHGGALAAPEIAPMARNSKQLQQQQQPSLTKSMAKPTSGEVAMSFMSAMRRGLNGLQHDSDDDDDDEDDDEDDEDDEESEGAYYQPAYSQYYAPASASSTASSSSAVLVAPQVASSKWMATAQDDDLIFAMEL